MAKYIVEDSYKASYEKNYKFPLVNIIPAIVGAFRFIRSCSQMQDGG